VCYLLLQRLKINRQPCVVAKNVNIRAVESEWSPDSWWPSFYRLHINVGSLEPALLRNGPSQVNGFALEIQLVT
jgi:hypothetical protein